MAQSRNIEAFASEEQLVKMMLSLIRSSGNRTYKVELEVDAGVGVADVLLYQRHPRTTRELLLLSKISPRLAPLLDPKIATQIHSRSDLANSLGLSDGAALRVVRQFQGLGLWNSDRAGNLLASVKVQPFQTIISVEAKLSDWSRALVQAYRNLQFSDESWVVLDHCFYKPALAQLERFQRSGVGLASVDINGSLFIHHPAPFAPAMSSTKRWHAQAALARRVTGNNSRLS